MITDADIEKLKQVFATKQDLERFATKDDLLNMEHRLDAKYATKDHLDHTIKELFQFIGEVQKDLKKDIKEVRYIAESIRVEMRTHRTILGEHEIRLESLESPVKQPSSQND